MRAILLALAAIACVAAVEFKQSEFAFGSAANVVPEQLESAQPQQKRKFSRAFRTVKTEIRPAAPGSRNARGSFSSSSTTSCSPLVGRYTYKMKNHHGIFGIPLRFGPYTVTLEGGQPLVDPYNAFDPINGLYNLYVAGSSIGIMTIDSQCTFTAEGEVLYFAQEGYFPSLDVREEFRAGTVNADCEVRRSGLYFEVVCLNDPDSDRFGWFTMGCTINSHDSFECVTSTFFGGVDFAGIHHITAQRTFGSVRDAPFDAVAEFDSDIRGKFDGVPELPPLHLHRADRNVSGIQSVINRVQVAASTSGRVSRAQHCSGIAGIFHFSAFTTIGAAGNFDYQLNRETAATIGFATIGPDCAFQIGGYQLKYYNPEHGGYPFAFGAQLENCNVYRSSNKWFSIDCDCDQNTGLRDQLFTNQFTDPQYDTSPYATDPDALTDLFGTEFPYIRPLDPSEFEDLFYLYLASLRREVDLCEDNKLLTMRCLMNSRFDIDCVASSFLGEWSTKTSLDITMTRMKDTSVNSELMPETDTNNQGNIYGIPNVYAG